MRRRRQTSSPTRQPHPAFHLVHGDPDCPRTFQTHPAPGPSVRAERIACGGCGASYPADARALLALARDHIFASRLIMAALPGRTALLRARRGGRHDPT